MIVSKTDTTRARMKLAAMRKGVRRTATDVLEAEGRIAAISLAKSTQPFGTGADAQDMGERAVLRDIAKVYTTIGAVFDSLPRLGKGDGRQFWKLIKAGKFEEAQRLIAGTGSRFSGVQIGPFDGGGLHKRARNSRSGRVSQKTPDLIVNDGRALKAYAQSKVNLVGFGKSAWAGLARQLGGTRGLRGPKLPSGESDITANWITRKGGPGAIVRNYQDAAHPSLELRSRVRYSDQILSPVALRRAVGIARGRIIKQIAISARYEMRLATQSARAA